MTDNLLERVPPQSLEAEQAVLGACLMEREAIDEAVGAVEPGDFYAPQHEILFRVICELHVASKPVDLITVETALQDRGRLESAGGRSYLIALQDPAPTASAVAHYAAIVKGKALLRRIILTAEDSRRLAQDKDGWEDPSAVLEKVQGLWQALASVQPQEGPYSVQQVFWETYQQIEEQQKSPNLRGMATGLDRWDNLTGGLHPGRFYVTGAYTGQGKTTLLTNVLSHLAFRESVPCALFSLEMGRHEIAQKIMAAEAGVDGFRLRMARLDDEEWWRVEAAVRSHENAPLYLDDNSAVTFQNLATKARQVVRKFGVRVIGVDYFQLVGTPRAESKRIGHVEVCHGLRHLARETGTAVLLLSQISRMSQDREKRRPRLSDFQETAALEQDANVATLIYHHPEGEPDPHGNVMELIVAKNRHGPSGSAPAWWDPTYQRVRDVQPGQVAEFEARTPAAKPKYWDD